MNPYKYSWALHYLCCYSNNGNKFYQIITTDKSICEFIQQNKFDVKVMSKQKCALILKIQKCLISCNVHFTHSKSKSTQ